MSRTLEIKIRVIRQKVSRRASKAFSDLGRYRWILFTSKNAALFFAREMRERHLTLPKGVNVAAVGRETARVLRRIGYTAQVTPEQFTVDTLIQKLGKVRGEQILFPRSAIAPAAAIVALRAQGARVTVVPLYTTVAMPLSKIEKRALVTGVYRRLIFKSPSGVHGLMEQLSRKEKQFVRKITAQCIGPTTARSAHAVGFKSVITKGVL